MKRIGALVIIICMIALCVSCVDYGVIEEGKYQQATAETAQVEQQEIQNMIDELLQDNQALEEQIYKLEQEKDQLVNEKYKNEDAQIRNLNEQTKDDTVYKKINDLLKEIIYYNSIKGKDIVFTYADVSAVKFVEFGDKTITFDRIEKELDMTFNPLIETEIDDPDYYNDDNYSNKSEKQEELFIYENAYIKAGGYEYSGFDEEAAKLFADIVYISDESLSYDWYVEDKQPKIDFDGNEIEQKHIFLICIVDDSVVMIIERG